MTLVDEVERVFPAPGGGVFAAAVAAVVLVDVHRAGPVLGWRRGARTHFHPAVEIEFLEGAVEVLDEDDLVLDVHRDDLEGLLAHRGGLVPISYRHSAQPVGHLAPPFCSANPD